MNKFDINFKNYSVSPVHASGKTISIIRDYFSGKTFNRVADVGCGAGIVGRLLIQQARELVFIDPSPNMLDHTRGLSNGINGSAVSYLNLSAEQLNKEDHGSFDLIVTRMAMHHFSDAEKAIRQMCSCLDDNAYLLISDLYGSKEKSAYTKNHRLELLHDETHIRNYTDAEIIDMVMASRPEAKIVMNEVVLELETGIDIAYWCSITNAGEQAVDEITNDLKKLDLHELKELGYIINGSGEVRNCVKTNLLIFHFRN